MIFNNLLIEQKGRVQYIIINRESKLNALNNQTINECVDKCPISHYKSPVKANENKLCLPCYKDCFGCTGPNTKIAPDGCTKCASALGNNTVKLII